MGRTIIPGLVAVLLVATLMVAAGPAASTDGDEPEPEGELVVAVPSMVRNLFPLSAVDPVTRLATSLIHEPLARYDHRGRLEPVLANSWYSEDGGETWIIHLRPEARWHDDTPFTAGDVIFTYELAMKGEELPFAVAPLFRDLIGVDRLHDHKIQLTLRRPRAALPEFVTVPMVAEHWVSRHGTWAYNHNPMGTGPFRLERWLAHTTCTFKAHESHWRVMPALKNIKLIPLEDPDLRRRAVETGYAHCAVDPSGGDDTEVLGVTDVVYLAMPSEPPFLAYTAARRAIEVTLQRELRREESFGIPATGPWPPASPLHRPEELLPLDDDPSLLLEEAGWIRDGMDGARGHDSGEAAVFSVLTPAWEGFPGLGNWIAATLEEIGVSAVPETVPLAEAEARLADRDYEAALVQVRVGPNPDLSHLLSSAASVPGGYNDARYVSPRMDHLLTRFTEGSSPEDADLAEEMWRVLSEDVPAVWLYYPETTVLHGEAAEGLRWLPGPLLANPEMITVHDPVQGD